MSRAKRKYRRQLKAKRRQARKTLRLMGVEAKK